MKTLQTIQTLFKLGKIFSKIIFVFCVVGGVGCAVGLIGLNFLPENFKLGGVTIHSMIERSEAFSLGDSYAALLMGLILCVGVAILCKQAERCFARSYAAQTPFCEEIAKEWIRFGIFTICVPVVTNALEEAAYHVLLHFFPEVVKLMDGDFTSIGIGFMLIAVGLIFRCGAETLQQDAPAE